MVFSPYPFEWWMLILRAKRHYKFENQQTLAIKINILIIKITLKLSILTVENTIKKNEDKPSKNTPRGATQMEGHLRSNDLLIAETKSGATIGGFVKLIDDTDKNNIIYIIETDKDQTEAIEYSNLVKLTLPSSTYTPTTRGQYAVLPPSSMFDSPGIKPKRDKYPVRTPDGRWFHLTGGVCACGCDGGTKDKP